MEWFRNINIGVLSIIVGTISVLGWILFDGTFPLVISIIAGSLIALKGAMSAAD